MDDNINIPYDVNAGLTDTDAITSNCLDTVTCNPYFLEYTQMDESINYTEHINNVTGLYDGVSYTENV